MLFNFSCTPYLVLALLCEVICTTLANMLIVANFLTISWHGECLLNFQRNLLLSDCHQVAYIQYLRGGASDDYPGVLTVYIPVP
jgi:hypothetical protein